MALPALAAGARADTSADPELAKLKSEYEGTTWDVGSYRLAGDRYRSP